MVGKDWYVQLGQEMADLVYQNMAKRGGMTGMPDLANLNLESKSLCYYTIINQQPPGQWQGPYVLKPIGEVDHLINMHDRQQKAGLSC